jgi:hypothetical protein
VVEAALGGALVPQTGCALDPSTCLAAARLAAVHPPPITGAADEEEPTAEAAEDEPKADAHESPSERAKKSSSLRESCETGRTSACRRVPEGPGSDPGPSPFRRAAWGASTAGARLGELFGRRRPPSPSRR